MSADRRALTTVVTGARRGIGKALALGVPRPGDAVVLHHHRQLREITAVAEEAAERGLIPTVVEADLASPEDIGRLVRDVEAATGGVDVLINNAAAASNAAWDVTGLDEWQGILDVNVTAPFLLARGFLPGMIERQWGRIINLASVTVHQGGPSGVAYVASKGAVVALTRALSRQLGEHGVTVNAISPGSILTEHERELYAHENPDALDARVIARQAIKRRLVADDLVGLARLLAEDASAALTGQCIEVNGGTVLR